MRRRWKTVMANTALVIVSIAVGYLIAELVFFRLLLPHISPNLRPHLPDRAAFFLQSSKAAHVPRDYIALAGDSYAAGIGDWLLSLGDKPSEPHHSGDVLYERLGRDVVTLGRVGSGSAEAMVLRVTRIYDDHYCYLFPPIELPKRLLVYFYEGNDIDDNHVLLRLRVRPDGSDLGGQVERFLSQQYGRPSAWRCHGHLGDTIFRMARFLVQYQFNREVTGALLDLPAANEVMIAGAPVAAPVLVAPSVTLREAEIDAAAVVFARSLAWLRRRFPETPLTLVYLPSPASIYRHADSDVIAADPFNPREIEDFKGGRVAVAAVSAKSQAICERIRAASLAHGAGFIDTRPTFRQAASVRPLHGPRDWTHLNEAGHRLLGSLLAERIDEKAADACDDRWPPS